MVTGMTLMLPGLNLVGEYHGALPVQFHLLLTATTDCLTLAYCHSKNLIRMTHFWSRTILPYSNLLAEMTTLSYNPNVGSLSSRTE